MCVCVCVCVYGWVGGCVRVCKWELVDSNESKCTDIHPLTFSTINFN